MGNKNIQAVMGEPAPGPAEPSHYRKFLRNLRHDLLYNFFKVLFMAGLATPAAGILVSMFLHHHRYYAHWIELVYLILGLMIYAYLIPKFATMLSDHFVGRPEESNEKT